MGEFNDLTGAMFGRIVVLCRTDDYVSPKGVHRTMWHCRCQCGNEFDATSSNLNSGSMLSCGCFNREQVSESVTKDLTGRQFGRLTVIDRFVGETGAKNRSVRWNCKCECGNEVVVQGDALRKGNTKSCGCYQRERSSKR